MSSLPHAPNDTQNTHAFLKHRAELLGHLGSKANRPFSPFILCCLATSDVKVPNKRERLGGALCGTHYNLSGGRHLMTWWWQAEIYLWLQMQLFTSCTAPEEKTFYFLCISLFTVCKSRKASRNCIQCKLLEFVLTFDVNKWENTISVFLLQNFMFNSVFLCNYLWNLLAISKYKMVSTSIFSAHLNVPSV